MGVERVARGQARCLILAHGAGSTAEFLGRAFPTASLGADAVYLDDRSGSAGRSAARIRAAAIALRPRYRQLFVGGVSIGSHAAAMVCAGAEAGLIDGCVLALPAWLGPCDPGGATATAAAAVAGAGAGAVLRRLASDPTTRDDWVLQELRLAWRDRPTLVEELRTASREPAPLPDELRRIGVPALVLALAHDPMHPLGMAQEWSALIPGASLAVLERDAPGMRRAVFGDEVGRWLGRLSEPR